jgi:tetratricopeptide (TPR) repeat protein
MARNGVTGEVVANQLLDRLVRLDAQTDSVRAPSTYDNDWRGNVKVEIPQIGISLGELNRYLRTWLGNEKRVSGELFRTAAGLSSLTVRTGSTPGDTQVGTATELDTLLDRAAESLYARTQPYRYATNLRQQNRFDEALLVYQALATGADENERPWGHIGTGQVLWITKGDRASYASFAKAAELDPRNALALTNLAGKGRRLGRIQAAADHLDQGIRAAEKPSGGVREDVPAAYHITLRAEQQLGRGDPIGAVALYQRTERQVGDLDNPLYGHARALAQSHRPSAAVRLVREVLPHSNDRLWVNAVNRLEVLLQAAAERGDWAGLSQASDLFLAAMAGSPRGLVEMQRVVHWRALALARTGRLAEAQQLIATSPRDCYPCLIARGWIAELNKDPRAADRWFADAVAQGPRLPFADTQWGLALSARGDLQAASEHFQHAATFAPRYADPLKHWGDVLVRQGKPGAAIEQYAAAAERAPHWGDLHLDWGLALQRLGKHDDARKSLVAAASMDLSKADRLRLQIATQG